MNEKKEILKTVGRFLIVLVFATLYCMGGTEDMGGKWIRRYLGPIILVLGMLAYSHNWKSLLKAPLMMITLSMGYGGTDLEWLKILKRGFWGVCNGLSSGFDGFLEKRLWLPVVQVIIVTGASILFGVYNVLPNARVEEFTIGALIAFIPVMSARRNK